MTTHTHLGHHAVVIGGSMAGLLTARILSDLSESCPCIVLPKSPA